LLLCLGLAGCAALIGLWLFRLGRPTYHSGLPPSASHVQEASLDLFPDSAYFLKAELPAAEFLPYVAQFGLTPHTSSRVYTADPLWLAWGHPMAPAWFDPTPSLEHTYVLQDGHLWVLAKYESGCLYLQSITH
jgi:hypothetical protein